MAMTPAPRAGRIRETHRNRLTILTVCTANICRSPLMELALRQQLDASAFEVGSAGIHGFVSQPMDAGAARQAERFGADPSSFTSRPISTNMVGVSDLILTATREHRSSVLSSSPTALRRSFTLLEFARLATVYPADSVEELIANASQHRSGARGELDIEDPYRRGDLVHHQVADRIIDAVRIVSGVLNDAAHRSSPTA